MKLIDTKKVKTLLQEKGFKNIALAKHLGIPASGISDALNGKRTLSMNYVFDVANFLEVDARSITYEHSTKQSTQQSSTEVA